MRPIGVQNDKTLKQVNCNSQFARAVHSYHSPRNDWMIPSAAWRYLQRTRYSAVSMGWKTPKTSPWDFVILSEKTDPRPATCIEKLVKMARVISEISCRTDRQIHRQTDRQTHRQTCSSQYFATASICGRSNKLTTVQEFYKKFENLQNQQHTISKPIDPTVQLKVNISANNPWEQSSINFVKFLVSGYDSDVED